MSRAPGWGPGPRFLPLYCKQQARCGGGYTDLLDYEDVIAELDADELTLMEFESIYFPGPEGEVTFLICHCKPSANRDNSSSVHKFFQKLLTSNEIQSLNQGNTYPKNL